MFTPIYVVMCRHAGTMSYICTDTDCCMASVVIAGWSLGARFIMREYFLSASETPVHYSDAIMGAMASEITSLMIVYSTVSSADQRKKPKLRVTGLCAGNWPVTYEFPAQMANTAEISPIWWRHREIWLLYGPISTVGYQ